MNSEVPTLEEQLKVQKIEAIKSCYGAEHLHTTVIPLMDDSKVTGWYYEEWGATLEEFMQNLFINNDKELLALYMDWVENLDIEDIEKLEKELEKEKQALTYRLERLLILKKQRLKEEKLRLQEEKLRLKEEKQRLKEEGKLRLQEEKKKHVEETVQRYKQRLNQRRKDLRKKNREEKKIRLNQEKLRLKEEILKYALELVAQNELITVKKITNYLELHNKKLVNSEISDFVKEFKNKQFKEKYKIFQEK